MSESKSTVISGKNNCQCATCGIAFHRKPSHVIPGGKMYCSHECRRVPKAKATCQQCGAEFEVRACGIKNGEGKYCGKPCRFASDRTHGLSGTPVYIVWKNMIDRCTNPDSKSWHWYGERGITICPEWIGSPTAFAKWAFENGYQDGLEIDRRDTNGNYEPGNCRWATRPNQMRNTRKREDGKFSRFKGVSRGGCDTSFKASIGTAPNRIYLGSFSTEEEAARAYDKAATEMWGEFANLNFPIQQNMKMLAGRV